MKKDSKNSPPTMKILVDTREKKPLTFIEYAGDLSIQVEKLDCGDYMLVGHDMPNDDYSVCIERKKDCLELANNLGKGWDRFCREMELMKDYKIKLLLVCSKNNFYDLYKQKKTQMHPNFIRSRLLDLQVRYGVHFMFFPTRYDVERYIYLLFHKILTVTEAEN